MPLYPKLIVPLRIDRAIGVRRYLLGRWLAQARQVTIGAVNRRRSQLAPSPKRRTVAGAAGLFRIRGPERGGGDDRARIGYTPGPTFGAESEATNSSLRASILGRHVTRGRAEAAPSRRSERVWAVGSSRHRRARALFCTSPRSITAGTTAITRAP